MSSLGGEKTTADARDDGARGRGPISRERAIAAQRARIVEAAVQVVAEEGFRGASMAKLVSRAGVSRAAFYVNFENFDDCFLAILDSAMRRSTGLMSEALNGSGPWPERAAAGLAALLSFLDSDPPLARICLVEALAAGPAVLEYRARELEVLKHMVDDVAGPVTAERRASLLGAEAVVASVAGILHTRLVRGEAPPFIDLLAPLVGVVLAPYLDAETIARQVHRAERLARSISEERASHPPRPPASVAIRHGLSNPGAHRARLCVLDLADHPGASNRAVGERIGVSHAGQMSGVLARLARKGLLVKRSGGPGHANAWSLTPEGELVVQALRQIR